MFDDQPATLWTLRRDGRLLVCRVRLLPYGIDVTLEREGAVLIARTFSTDQEALAWADQKRTARRAAGWMPLVPAPGAPGRLRSA
jgi:hypothetical protein